MPLCDAHGKATGTDAAEVGASSIYECMKILRFVRPINVGHNKLWRRKFAFERMTHEGRTIGAANINRAHIQHRHARTAGDCCKESIISAEPAANAMTAGAGKG